MDKSFDLVATAKVMVLTLMMAREAVELTWTTEFTTIKSCEGQDKLLLWNFSLEKNETIKQVQWWYNKTKPICLNSESQGFHVENLFEGRVEQNGTTGILLKKVSMNDTGEYTLYPKLALEQHVHKQNIFLTIYETPTNQCKPVITVISEYVIFCEKNTCERSQLSFEWRIKGKSNPVGRAGYLTINSSWNGEIVSCCPPGPNMECHKGDQSEICAEHLINFEGEDKGSKENLGTMILLLMITVILLLLLVMVFILAWNWRKKMKQNTFQSQLNQQDQSLQLTERQSVKDESHRLIRVNHAAANVRYMDDVDTISKITEFEDGVSDDVDTMSKTTEYEDAVSAQSLD